MAVTVNRTDKFYQLKVAGLNWASDDIRAVPLTNSYTFSKAHDFANDLSGEVTTNGGTRVALTNKAVITASNIIKLDADDVVWTASGGSLTIRQVALVRYTGGSGDSDRALLMVLTNDSDVTVGPGNSISWRLPSGGMVGEKDA